MYRKLVERHKNGEKSYLSDRIEKGQEITLEHLIEAINHEDMLCIELAEELGYKLGRNIAGLINIFNPELVVIGGILSNGGCNKSHEKPQKTLSAEIRLHRDCDSRWVADSAPEVFLRKQSRLFGPVVYKAHIWILSTVG